MQYFDIAELHTYLALAGNQRLPHLEEEIFADETATTIYLHNLCKELKWYDDQTLPSLVYYYSRYVIKGRWKAAEHIVENSLWHYWYENVCSSFLTTKT